VIAMLRGALLATGIAAAFPVAADTGSPPGSGEAIIRAFKDSEEAATIRGSAVYKTYCQLCHGAEGEGNGRAARLYTPKPANLVSSSVNDDYKELIVRRGGEGVGRSKFMPPWGEQLTDEQISDVVTFMRSIRKGN